MNTTEKKSIKLDDLLIQHPVTALVCPNSGLNDTISSLAFHIRMFRNNRWNLENLYVTNQKYDHLEKYFDFKVVNYVDIHEIAESGKKFSFISRLCDGSHTHADNKMILDYVSLKKEIIDLVEDHSDKIGVHFRCMDIEQQKVGVGKAGIDLLKGKESKRPPGEEEVEEYLNAFKKIYRKEEKYLVVSDNSYFKRLEEEYSNVTCHIPDHAGNNEKTLLSALENRRDGTLDAIKSFIALGKCKKIHTTKGSFAKLSCFVNRDIKIEKII
jgi:hypothetical protein